MNISAELINQIVRDVMQELRARQAPVQAERISASGSAQTPASTASQSAASPSTASPSAAQPPLTITHTVVSEDVLQSAGAAGRTVTLLPAAVITPSGRDYIRQHRVCLSSARSLHTQQPFSGLLLTIGEASAAQSAAVTAGWEVCRLADEFSAAEKISEAASDLRVLCSGGEPSLVCCLLNRDPHMRAAVMTRHSNLTRLSQVMAPTVICIESSGWSMVDVLRLMRLPWHAAARPEKWQELGSRHTEAPATSAHVVARGATR